MMYRKYKMIIAGLLLTVSLGVVGCAGNQVRSPDSIEQQQNDGNEPAYRPTHRDFTWLNGVEDDFGKVAAAGSNRSLASHDQEVLFKKKNYSFVYQKSSNQFYLNLNGQSYRMVQTTLGEGSHYSFAAEASVENPPALSISSDAGIRGPASNPECTINLGYFNKSRNAYTQDQVHVDYKSCTKMTQRLKDYVP